MKANSSVLSGKFWLAAVTVALFLLPVTAAAQAGNSGRDRIGNINGGRVGVVTTVEPGETIDLNAKLKIRSGGLFLENTALLRAGGGNRVIPSSPPFAPVELGTNNPSDYLVFKAGGVERATISPDGNVGIGTTSPGTALEVAADRHVAPLAILRNTGTGSVVNGLGLYTDWSNSGARNWGLIFNALAGGDFTLRQSNTQGGNPFSAGTDRFYIDGSGNVGIGTTSPGTALEVAADRHVAPLAILRNTGTGSVVNGLGLYTDWSNSGARNWGLIFNALAGGDFTLRQSNTQGGNPFSAGTDRFYIDGSGNVGIGTTSPNARLEIKGDLKVSAEGFFPGNITAAGTIDAGTIKARYQDVAEWVPASEQLAAGTVVVLDSTKSNQVISSSVRYDTRVAGVISAQPGIALGEKSENKVLVATTGRVRVKVDASKGPIHVGDLLVTSDIPGVAMRSKPVNLGGVQFHRPGTLIGKALEPLEKGKGEILVLLSLQ